MGNIILLFSSFLYSENPYRYNKISLELAISAILRATILYSLGSSGAADICLLTKTGNICILKFVKVSNYISDFYTKHLKYIFTRRFLLWPKREIPARSVLPNLAGRKHNRPYRDTEKIYIVKPDIIGKDSVASIFV